MNALYAKNASSDTLNSINLNKFKKKGCTQAEKYNVAVDRYNYLLKTYALSKPDAAILHPQKQLDSTKQRSEIVLDSNDIASIRKLDSVSQVLLINQENLLDTFDSKVYSLEYKLNSLNYTLQLMHLQDIAYDIMEQQINLIRYLKWRIKKKCKK